MPTTFGTPIDPQPFIMLAYATGLFGLMGYTLWVIKDRLALRKLATVVAAHPKRQL